MSSASVERRRGRIFTPCEIRVLLAVWWVFPDVGLTNPRSKTPWDPYQRQCNLRLLGSYVKSQDPAISDGSFAVIFLGFGGLWTVGGWGRFSGARQHCLRLLWLPSQGTSPLSSSSSLSPYRYDGRQGSNRSHLAVQSPWYAMEMHKGPYHLEFSTREYRPTKYFDEPPSIL